MPGFGGRKYDDEQRLAMIEARREANTIAGAQRLLAAGYRGLAPFCPSPPTISDVCSSWRAETDQITALETAKHAPVASVRVQVQRAVALIDAELSRLERQSARNKLDLEKLRKATAILTTLETLSRRVEAEAGSTAKRGQKMQEPETDSAFTDSLTEAETPETEGAAIGDVRLTDNGRSYRRLDQLEGPENGLGVQDADPSPKGSSAVGVEGTGDGVPWRRPLMSGSSEQGISGSEGGDSPIPTPEPGTDGVDDDVMEWARAQASSVPE